jgi:hypothetical protein
MAFHNCHSGAAALAHATLRQPPKHTGGRWELSAEEMDDLADGDSGLIGNDEEAGGSFMSEGLASVIGARRPDFSAGGLVIKAPSPDLGQRGSAPATGWN